MGSSRQIEVLSVRQLSIKVNGFYSTMIVSQERGRMYEDAGLFSTCNSYSQSYDDDAELSDS